MLVRFIAGAALAAALLAPPALAKDPPAPDTARSVPAKESPAKDTSGKDSSGKPAPGAKEPSPGQAAARERQKKCGTEWREFTDAQKTAQGPKWPQFWSKCNKRLKGTDKA